MNGQIHSEEHFILIHSKFISMINSLNNFGGVSCKFSVLT
jgi:hypothetical protein